MFPNKTSNLLLPSGTGMLELAVSIPELVMQDAIVIICHPHPLYQGTMDNKVVTTLMRAYNNLGMPVVRFNYRGVGKSTGVYGDGIGECDDLKTVWGWVLENNPNKKIYLAGFSFGAYIALRVATERVPESLVLIAPPVTYPWFETFEKMNCSCLIVQGLRDDVVLPEDVKRFASRLDPKPAVVLMDEASHFFHGCLVELRTVVEQWV